MKKNTLGFSFVELIIVISIISIISVIGISINKNYTEKTQNTTISANIKTIKNALESFRNDTKTLPTPMGNQKFFDDSSNYVHYDDVNAFGVNGFITEKTIPKKYLDSLPLDPRTNQYYAYGKTLTGGYFFEVSGVNKVNGNYESMVVGDYSGETGPYNLIREFNGPNFVYDKSRSNFPYNPDERLLKAKIGTFSGLVRINGTTIVNQTWIKENSLSSGDTIFVGAGSEAVLYFSDGSKSYLGDDTSDSELVLANMQFKEENNLYTKIQLALSYGSILTKASKLDPNSEFEVYTTDVEAGVRGTIFSVSKSNWDTIVTVETGSVNVKKMSYIPGGGAFEQIVSNLEKGVNNDTQIFQNFSIPTNLPISIDENNEIITIDGGGKFKISYYPTVMSYSPTTLPDNDGLSNIKMDIISMGSGTVKLGFPSSFSGASKEVLVDNDNYTNFVFDKNILTLTGLTNTNHNIKVCEQNGIICTKELSLDLTSGLNYENKEAIKQVGLCDEFGQFGCIEKDNSLTGFTLIAYAPYDTPGDLKLYSKNGVWDNGDDTDGILLKGLEDNDEYVIGANSGVTYDKNSSFYDNNGVKGIFIGSGATKDYLKYDISQLGLGNDFAVEIGMRGEALKRAGNNKYYLFYGDVYLYKNSVDNKYKTLAGWLSPLVSNNLVDINDKIFYKTILINDKSGNKIYLKIGDSNIGYISPASNTLGNIMYIGSNNSSDFQWNDIIEYVKIYKKN